MYWTSSKNYFTRYTITVFVKFTVALSADMLIAFAVMTRTYAGAVLASLSHWIV